jgi:glutaredoxin
VGSSERAIFIIDKQGLIQYIDIHDVDDLPDNEVLFSELRRIDPEAAQQASPEPEAQPLPYGGIVMYCTQWCTDCIQARAWLKERNLDYTEVDVYSVPGALEQAREWAGNRLITPTFNIDGTIVVDFDVARLEQVLGE